MTHCIATDFANPINVESIARLFNKQLNIIAASGDPVATLSHKDDKVNVNNDTQLSNLKISTDIAKVLKIKGNTSNTGEPVDVDKIAFNNTKNVFLVCDQIDSTLINNRDLNTVTAAACVDEIIPFEKPNANSALSQQVPSTPHIPHQRRSRQQLANTKSLLQTTN